MSDESGPTVLVLGLDAACRRVLDPLLEDGLVPNLADLLDSGVSGPLSSQIPPWTPSAWPSLFTGVNPGKHGVYGFLSFDGYDWRVVNYGDVRAHSLWELLDYHDRTSVVVNVPVTHPPQPIDGAVIPGYTAPEDPDCHPSGILDAVRAEIGEYRVYAPKTEERSAQIEGYRSLVRMRGGAFRYLCDRFEPDFGFVQFQQTDTVFHERPDDDEAIEAVYRAVDREIGEILAATDPDLVAVVSDHGMGPMGGHEFRANDFLRDHGYLETTRGGEMPSWSTVASTQLRDGGDGESPDRSSAERLFAQLSRAGLTSQRLERVLSTLGLRDVVLRFAPERIVQAAAEQPDFQASQAYMRDRIECGIRLNVAGREPDGTVPAEEYEQVRTELMEHLRGVETPAGRPVFERVLRRENVYHGPHVEEAADIIVVPTAFDEFLSTSLRGETFGPVPESYNHKFEGLVAMTGPAVDTDCELGNATLLDIAPTLLSALNVPLSERFDGTALPAVPPAAETTYPEYTETETKGATAGESVEQRLADLGYIE
jgi:predicted AlkP superfamily phosphohydrolase/phosphomutase